jgi:hypothetical protein
VLYNGGDKGKAIQRKIKSRIINMWWRRKGSVEVIDENFIEEKRQNGKT